VITTNKEDWIVAEMVDEVRRARRMLLVAVRRDRNEQSETSRADVALWKLTLATRADVLRSACGFGDGRRR
jgi:hypothetical protein